ncbi:hypothetical protein Tco_0316439 [Tanacetum coccineum]
MVQIMIKNPPLEQTGGPKEEGQEKSLLLPVLQEKRQPRQQERLLLQEFETGIHDEQADEEVQHLPDWFQQPTRLPSPDHAWNKSVPAVHESVQPWISNLAQRQDPRESFDELTDNTFDFSAFVMNRLNVQTLTPELLADMLLLLVQGKVTNLNVEERIAFNVSLRMFTRRVVIQRRVEDLQLGVESYQKNSTPKA